MSWVATAAAGLCEGDGDGRAHASGGAGDERNLVVEAESIKDVWHMGITLLRRWRGGQTRVLVCAVLGAGGGRQSMSATMVGGVPATA